MRALFIVTRADAIGGVQVHVRDVAAALIERGHDVLVVTGPRGVYSEALERTGTPTVACPPLQRAIDPRRDAPALLALRREIATYAPDIVSTHTSKAGTLGRLACAGGGPPCLFTAHGWSFTEGVPPRQRAVYRRIERVLAPLTARIICVSHHDRALGVAAGIAPARLITIHNGMVDIPGNRRADPGRPGPVRVASIARFVPQKDHATLLRAAAVVDGLHLDLIGDGPHLPAMRELAGALGMAGRVRFLGHQDDVAPVLAEAHAFALTSHWEGFPRSTLEAMRAGLPTVVTDAGGSAEAVVEGETGFVVPRGDVAAVTERLRRLAADADLRARLGAAARSRYETRFTFARMFAQTLAVYHDVVGS